MAKPVLLIIGKPDLKSQDRLLAELGPDADVVLGSEAAGLAPAARRAEIVFLWDNLRGVLRQLWPELTRLRWIHTRAAGLDTLWFPELTASAVMLTNSKGIYSRALAEFVLAAMLFFAKNLRGMLAQQAERRWAWMDLDELRGRAVGILGYGDIGRAVARIAKAMGMRVIAVRRRPSLDGDEPDVDRLLPADRFLEMMAASDYAVITAPLTPETRGLIDEKALRTMRPTAYLINIGRGAVVQEAALARALEEGWIAGAALDVFEREPLLADSPFYRLPNVLISPHSADHTPGWVEAGLELFLENFRRYRLGQPLKNIVDKRAGY